MHSNLPEEIRIRKGIYSIFLMLVISIFFISIIFLSSCQYLPQVADDLEKVLDNDAITIKCDKDCFQKQTDVEVSVKVMNKDKEVK